jgi:hypothetical protein
MQKIKLLKTCFFLQQKTLNQPRSPFSPASLILIFSSIFAHSLPTPALSRPESIRTRTAADWQKSQNPKQIVVGTVSNFSVESRKIDIISFFLVPKNN